MHSYLSDSDIAAVIRDAHAEGAHVGAVLSGGPSTRALFLDLLARGGVETQALDLIVLGDGIPGTHEKARLGTATEHLVRAKDARLVVFGAPVDGFDFACGVLYSGEPVASVKDVTDALEDGDALDVRLGELWIESPAGSGQWHRAGRILHTVAVELRKAGVLVGL